MSKTRFAGWAPDCAPARRRRAASKGLLWSATCCAVAFGMPSGTAHADGLEAFDRIACVPTDGVQFCQGSAPVTGSCLPSPVPCDTEIYDPAVPDTRVPSWDGTPLDVNLTLPLHASQNLPLIVLIHGFPALKEGLDGSDDIWTGTGSREWALRGYAVLSYSSRGQGDSCGWPASRVGQLLACATGWQHLDDVRYEARDTQWLASMLADEGIVDPQRIGVAGGSYGGGQSLELATLRDRVMLPDGSLVPWVSPQRHLPMRIAAAAPVAAWSDMTYAVVPNGHDLDYALTPLEDHLQTLGAVKLSTLDALYAALQVDSYMPPPGSDPLGELVTLSQLGWPAFSQSNPALQDAWTELTRYHSAAYLPDHEAPAPTLVTNGWNDDIFPVAEEMRWVNQRLAAHPDAPIAMFLGDLGHGQRGQNKPADMARQHQTMIDWFAHYLLGSHTAVVQGVEALTTTCPASAPSGGPYLAPSWPAMHPGEVRFDGGGEQTIASLSGSPVVGTAIDPFAGSGACASPPAADVVGTATYRFPVGGSGFTLMGSPTVVADLAPSGEGTQPYPYIAAHLFVIDPGSTTERLIDRITYRPAGPGRQVFQLNAQAYHFAPGDTIKLELAGQDSPYSEPDVLPGTISVSDLQLRIPAAEPPDCTTILSPAAPVVPSGDQLAPGVDAQSPDACAQAAN